MNTQDETGSGNRIYYGQFKTLEDGRQCLSTLSEEIIVDKIDVSETVNYMYNLTLSQANNYNIVKRELFDYIYEVEIIILGDPKKKVALLRKLLLSASDASWKNASTSLRPFFADGSSMMVKSVLWRYGPSCICASVIDFDPPITVEETYYRWVQAFTNEYRIMQMHLTDGRYLYSSGGPFKLIETKPFFEISIEKKSKNRRTRP